MIPEMKILNEDGSELKFIKKTSVTYYFYEFLDSNGKTITLKFNDVEYRSLDNNGNGSRKGIKKELSPRKTRTGRR
jgi:hypothetical protein